MHGEVFFMWTGFCCERYTQSAVVDFLNPSYSFCSFLRASLQHDHIYHSVTVCINTTHSRDVTSINHVSMTRASVRGSSDCYCAHQLFRTYAIGQRENQDLSGAFFARPCIHCNMRLDSPVNVQSRKHVIDCTSAQEDTRCTSLYMNPQSNDA